VANATTSTAAPTLDLNPYVALRQAIEKLITACEHAVNGGANAAFDHIDDVRNAEELALAAWVTADLWRDQIESYLDELDVMVANGTATPQGAATPQTNAAPAPPAPVVRDAAELPPHRGRPYWLP
jgi:hypothetical protein